MCGICGFTRAGINLPQSIIEDMKGAIRHRGPDEHGTWADDQVVLGHTRLSIIDLISGQQPMSDASRTLWVTFNGEIYNFQELATSLRSQGYHFNTRSDTEVLLYLYQRYGIDMLHKLEGMFAFALWDGKNRTLFLARDRFGKKPLYYTLKRGQLIFASELKALVRHPHINPRLCKPALSQYLAFEYVPAPLSIYEDIYKLEAGAYLLWQDRRLQVEKYWDYPLDVPPYRNGFADGVQELMAVLEQAVLKRLISDVPLGVFLSGGIDSSTIVSLMARHVPPQKIKTFSIGFKENSYDESTYAQLVARRLQTNHHQLILDAAQAIDILPQVVAQFDEPFADASALPTYLLCRFTRQEVTVALSGDGGDELFAGYDPFLAHRIANIVRIIPRVIFTKALHPAARLLPLSDRNMNLSFRLNRFLPHVHQNPVLRNQLWLGAFTPEAQSRLLTPDFAPSDNPYHCLDDIGERTASMHWLPAVQFAFIKTYLADDILTKVDRASMGNSLEVRSPFLDTSVGQLSATLPAPWKLKGFTTKYILRKGANHLLPSTIINRSKKGFGIPKAQWLRQELRPFIETAFSDKALDRFGIFSKPYVRQLMRQHFGRQRDHQKDLWTLLMFEMWRQQHGPV